MKQCSLCSRTRTDNNLWCQEPRCPAEWTPTRMRPGDFLGELRIIKWVSTLPSAMLYQARQSGVKVLLKVANPGFEEKLKREALFLQRHNHPTLPRLLPAHTDASIEEYPYGKVAVQGQVHTYAIFTNFPGRTLQEWLLRNSQPWHRHVGWIVASLADVVAYLHDCGLYHLTLSPTVVMVRCDEQNVIRPLLVDLGICAAFEDIGRYWQPQLTVLSWMAPELCLRQPISPQTDVYGLGLLLQRMLSGETIGTNHLVNTATSIHRADSITKHKFRPDLQGLPQLAQRSISVDDRPADVLQFANELLSYTPIFPSEKRNSSLQNHLLLAISLAGLGLSALILLAILF